MGEEKIIGSIPSWSDDGRVVLFVRARGAKSGKRIEKDFTINNKVGER